MKTDFFSLRVNLQLKEAFYDFCKSKGFTAGKAVKLFARQFAVSGVLPWGLDADRTYPDDNTTRISIHMDAETREMFANACKNYNDIAMSVVVRGFMDYCVTNNRFPYDESGSPRLAERRGKKKRVSADSEE